MKWYSFLLQRKLVSELGMLWREAGMDTLRKLNKVEGFTCHFTNRCLNRLLQSERRCSTSACSVSFSFCFELDSTHSNNPCFYSRYHSQTIKRDLVTLFKPQTLPSMHTLRHFTGFKYFSSKPRPISRFIHAGCGNFFLFFNRDKVLRRHGGTAPDKYTETSGPVNLSGTGRALMPLCTIHHSLTVPRSCSDLFFAHFKNFSFFLFVFNSENVNVCVCAHAVLVLNLWM